MASGREKGDSSRTRKTTKKRESVVGCAKLPPRIFATNRYPPDGRINFYSKPEYLLDLVHALEGTPELGKLMESPFGSLFQLPVRKCSMSGKLVHNILCRGLVTHKEHELWFAFGKNPIRFSLREFAIVTGLPCGPFPPVEKIRQMQTTPEGENRYWDTLICSKHATTVQEIVNMLKRDQRKPVDKKMPGWRRFRLALIVIVEGILICGSHPVRASLEVVEMVRNLESFMAYPWGRESFELTLRMIKVGSKVETQEMLLDKLLQSHTLCHGFPVAIQLLIFRACPLLEQYLPTDDDETFAETEKLQLAKLKSYHNNNILQTEFDSNVQVEMIIQPDAPINEAELCWPSDDDDPAVEYLQSLIEEGHQFKTEDWRGGHTGCALMTPAPAKRAVRQLRLCDGSVKKKHKQRRDDEDDDDLLYQIEVINYSHTMELQKWWESEKVKLKADLKREILRELQVSRSGGGGGKEVGSVGAEVNIGDVTILRKVDGDDAIDMSTEDVVENQNLPDDVHGNLSPKSSNYGMDMSTKDVDENPNVPDDVKGRRISSNDESDMSTKDEDQNPRVVDDVQGSPVSSNDGLDMSTKDEDENLSQVPHNVYDHGTATSIIDVRDMSTNDVEENPKSTDYVHDPASPISSTDAMDKVNIVLGKLHDSGCLSERVGDNPDEASSKEEDVVEDEGVDEESKDEEEPNGPADKAMVQNDEFEENDGSDGDSDEVEEMDKGSIDEGQDDGDSRGVFKRGEKRPNDLVDSDISNLHPCRPKRARVVPRRFCSLTPGKINTGAEDSGVYTPLGGVDGQKKKKYLATLGGSRNKEYIIDGHVVKKTFFKGIHTPKNWVDTPQIEAMLSLVWRKRGESLVASRIGVLDTWFIHTLVNEYRSFKKHKRGELFPWNSLIRNSVRGIVPSRATRLMWFRDVDVVYAPMNVGKGHWVALAIELLEGKIHILDPLIKANAEKKLKNAMAPIVTMLPTLIKDILSPAGIEVSFPTSFAFERVANVSQNERTGDCGPLTVKFIELDAQGFELDGITDDMVDELRMKYAVDIFEEFVHALGV